MTAPSDEDLMHLIATGDAAAFDALFGRHQRTTWAYVRRTVSDRRLAEELFQEIWLKVYRGAASFREGARFRPWLFSISANTARDLWRKQGRRVELVELTSEPTSRASGGEARENEKALLAAIDALPDNLREAFVMGAVQGFDHNEVAEALDISPANARARISRARAALKAALKEGK